MRNMGNLPGDAIAEILARLPIKSLFRFKCVSNSWNHLISHPYFLNLRALHKRSTRELRLIYVEHGKNTDGRIRITATDTEGKLINQFSLPGNSSAFPVDRLYPTRFELICFHNDRGEIWLCNPTTRQLLALPYPSSTASELDRLYSPYHNIGFGYSSSRDEYKVVQLCNFRDQIGPIFGICCEVYSVSSEADHHQCSNGWRIISEKCPHPIMGAATCVQDVLHWMASNEFFRPLVAIVSFDLNEEKFRTMPVSPQWMEMCEPNLYDNVLVVEFWGRLCLFNYWSYFEDMTIGVWMVKDYDKGLLEKCYTINLAHMEDAGKYLQAEFFPITYVGNDELLLNGHGIDRDDTLNYYNTRTKAFRTVHVGRPHPACFGFFWQNLAPPKKYWAAPSHNEELGA